MRSMFLKARIGDAYMLAKVESPSWRVLTVGLLVSLPLLALGYRWLGDQLYEGDTPTRAIVRWLKRGLR